MSQLHGGGSSSRHQLLSEGGALSSTTIPSLLSLVILLTTVYKYCSVLTSPFETGAGAKLIPQNGFTQVLLHGVPVQRETDGSVADTHPLL